MTAQWEHLTVHIRWDAEQQQWRSDWSEDCSHASYNDILNAVGEAAWELASFTPLTATIIDWPLPSEVKQQVWAVTNYTAIFKRRKA